MGDALTLLGIAAQLTLASVLLLAGFSKVVTPRELRQVLTRLGLAGPVAGVATALVIAAEIAAGVALLTVPAQAWPRALTLVLAVGFAGAGAVALLRRERIACHCFGGIGSGALGRRQLALLPVWLLVTAPAQWQPPTWGPDVGLLLVSVALLVLAALQVPRERRLRSEVTHARVALAVGMPAPSAPATTSVTPSASATEGGAS